MLWFLQKNKEKRLPIQHYFPIFAAIILSVLFSICVVHYANTPLFFVTSSLSVSGCD